MTAKVIQTQTLDACVPRRGPRTFSSEFRRPIANRSGTATKPQITARGDVGDAVAEQDDGADDDDRPPDDLGPERPVLGVGPDPFEKRVKPLLVDLALAPDHAVGQFFLDLLVALPKPAVGGDGGPEGAHEQEQKRGGELDVGDERRLEHLTPGLGDGEHGDRRDGFVPQAFKVTAGSIGSIDASGKHNQLWRRRTQGLASVTRRTQSCKRGDDQSSHLGELKA
jgi:hypothetical protein